MAVLGVLFLGLLLTASCGKTGIWIQKSEEDTVLSSEDPATGTPEKEEESSAETAETVVYVCGAVAKEGVYTLPEGSRKEDALKAAGGYSPSAARGIVNLAEILTDGERIWFPTKEEAEKETAGTSADDSPGDGKNESSGRININTAGVGELTTLTGIGETRAEEILRYREKNGPFKKPEDLMKVPGIKEGTYRKISDRISTE